MTSSISSVSVSSRQSLSPMGALPVQSEAVKLSFFPSGERPPSETSVFSPVRKR